MAVITFMSDFGDEDHYVASVKATILRHAANSVIIDISHKVVLEDVGHAAFLLKSTFREFPKGTVHLCAIDRPEKTPSKMIALYLEGHVFVGPDSGLFTLISEDEPEAIIEIQESSKNNSTFPAKDILAPVAAALANGGNILDLGEPLDIIRDFLPRNTKATKREIIGNVIHIDHYGNLITNIDKKEFEVIHKINNYCSLTIRIGRYEVKKIHQTYTDVDPGNCFVFFNSINLLEIGVNRGNASELMGIRLDSNITIYFHLQETQLMF